MMTSPKKISILWVIACLALCVMGKPRVRRNLVNERLRSDAELQLVITFPKEVRHSLITKAALMIDDLKYMTGYPKVIPRTLLYPVDLFDDEWSYMRDWTSIPPMVYNPTSPITRDNLFHSLYQVMRERKVFANKKRNHLVLVFADTVPPNPNAKWPLWYIHQKILPQNVMFIIFAVQDVLEEWMLLSSMMSSNLFQVLPLLENMTNEDVEQQFHTAIVNISNYVTSGADPLAFTTQPTVHGINVYESYTEPQVTNPEPPAVEQVHYVFMWPHERSRFETLFYQDIVRNHKALLLHDFLKQTYSHVDGSLVNYWHKDKDPFIQAAYDALGWGYTEPMSTGVVHKIGYKSNFEEAENAKSLIDALASPQLVQLMRQIHQKYAGGKSITVFLVPLNKLPPDVTGIEAELEQLCLMTSQYNGVVAFLMKKGLDYQEFEKTWMTKSCFKYVLMPEAFGMLNLIEYKKSLKAAIDIAKTVELLPVNPLHVAPASVDAKERKAKILLIFQQLNNVRFDEPHFFLWNFEWLKRRLNDVLKDYKEVEYLFSLMDKHDALEVAASGCPTKSLETYKFQKEQYCESLTLHRSSLIVQLSFQCLLYSEKVFNNPDGFNVIISFVDGSRLYPSVDETLQTELAAYDRFYNRHAAKLVFVAQQKLLSGSPVFSPGSWTLSPYSGPHDILKNLVLAIQ